jgi:cellulose synthase/poly-beta-1,6-N-acetylglucosamine synthase-like glycosyltransferase
MEELLGAGRSRQVANPLQALDAALRPEGRAAEGELLGEKLVSAGWISRQQLEEALEEQRRTGARLGQVLLARGWVRAFDFYQALAEHLGLPFVNLLEQPPDAGLIDPDRMEEYCREQYMPWRRSNDTLWVAVAEPAPGLFEKLRQMYGPATDFVCTSKFDILWTVQRLGRSKFSEDARLGLWRQRQEFSARTTLTRRQKVWLAVAAAAAAAGFCLQPAAAFVWANALLGAFLAASFLLRALLVWHGSSELYQARISPEQLEAQDERKLPVYTILVPLYRDAKVVPALSWALRSLDYPRSRLDIKLVLEEDDEETIRACREAGLEANVELILVPPGEPRTKPKALNYALRFARGELLTIYDAEDLPDPLQLRRAVAAFQAAPADVVCLQARLNYFNWNENWLARMFTIEYSLWFDWFLPGLEALGIPIPLGGTSNHFRTEVLRALGGWDPFNVTEDADLGVRFTASGWRVGVLDSTTLEEANIEPGNWVRQRSRWIKGYLQTWLVHMRRPLWMARRMGFRGFVGFHFFIGGAFVGPLAYPWLATLFLLWLVARIPVEPLFPPPVMATGLFCLLVGNGFLVFFHMLAAWARQRPSLVFCALTLPAYYLLMSVAAYKALWQLVRKPHYWEKTEHGLTSVSAAPCAPGA